MAAVDPIFPEAGELDVDFGTKQSHRGDFNDQCDLPAAQPSGLELTVASLLSYFPKPIAGGVLLFLGLSFLNGSRFALN